MSFGSADLPRDERQFEGLVGKERQLELDRFK